MRGFGVCGAALALLSGLQAGCDDEVRHEFRQAANSQLRTGVQSILLGLTDGAFAVLDGQPPDTSSTGTSGG